LEELGAATELNDPAIPVARSGSRLIKKKEKKKKNTKGGGKDRDRRGEQHGLPDGVGKKRGRAKDFHKKGGGGLVASSFAGGRATQRTNTGKRLNKGRVRGASERPA